MSLEVSTHTEETTIKATALPITSQFSSTAFTITICVRVCGKNT